MPAISQGEIVKLKFDETEIDLSFVPEEHHSALQSALSAGYEAAVQGLKTKRDQLLGNIKLLQERVRDPDDKTVADLTRQVSELTDQRVELQHQVTQAKTQAEQLQGKLDGAVKESTEWRGKHDGLVVDQALTTELARIGVNNPHRQQAVKAMLKEQGSITLAEDGGINMGDKALTEALDAWKDSDVGKVFVSAADNAGGDAGGSDGDGGGDFSGPNPFVRGDNFSLSKQDEIEQQNPELAKRLEAQATAA